MVGQELHVRDVLHTCFLHERRLVGALAGKHIQDLVWRRQLRGVEDDVQPLGEAMRTGVEKDLAPVEPEFLGKRAVGSLRAIGGCIHAVREKEELFTRHAAIGQTLQHSGRWQGDSRRPPVDVHLEHLCEADREPVSEHPELDR